MDEPNKMVMGDCIVNQLKELTTKEEEQVRNQKLGISEPNKSMTFNEDAISTHSFNSIDFVVKLIRFPPTLT